MKKLLLSVSVLAVFAACSSKKENESTSTLVPMNTAGYSVSNASTDIAKPAETVLPEKIQQTVPVKTRIITRTVYVPREEKVQPVPVVSNAGNNAPVVQPQADAPQATVPTATGTSDASTTDKESASTETASAAKKKGWSDAAKGAVIGGAAGAIGGAVINGKNRGKGAVIGAVIGAAGGYVIGRKRDKNKEDANQYSMVVN